MKLSRERRSCSSLEPRPSSEPAGIVSERQRNLTVRQIPTDLPSHLVPAAAGTWHGQVGQNHPPEHQAWILSQRNYSADEGLRYLRRLVKPDDPKYRQMIADGESVHREYGRLFAPENLHRLRAEESRRSSCTRTTGTGGGSTVIRRSSRRTWTCFAPSSAT